MNTNPIAVIGDQGVLARFTHEKQALPTEDELVNMAARMAVEEFCSLQPGNQDIRTLETIRDQFTDIIVSYDAAQATLLRVAARVMEAIFSMKPELDLPY